MMEDCFVELTYRGGLQLEKVTFRKSMVSNVQKPKADTFGCIVQTDDGSKFPVEESYEFVLKALGAKEI